MVMKVVVVRNNQLCALGCNRYYLFTRGVLICQGPLVAIYPSILLLSHPHAIIMTFWWFYLWATTGHQCAQGCCTPSCPLHTPKELSMTCWRPWQKTWMCWTRRVTLPLDFWCVEIPGFKVRKILVAPTPAIRYNIAERRSDGGSLWLEWRAIGPFSAAVFH